MTYTDGGLYKGIIFKVRDVSGAEVDRDLGSPGTVRDPYVTYMGGPFHALYWRTNDVISYLNLGFNSCHCDFTAGAFTTPV